MAQQINLCTPILLKPKQYFSAQTMVVALAVFIGLGGAMAAAWVWNMRRATDGLNQVMQNQARDIDNLKAAIARSRAAAQPADPALLAQLEATRASVRTREGLLQALRQGLFVPGWGHSDRLQWVSRTIPAPVWVNEISMDAGHFEVKGYTLEPSALNAWVDKLATSPLMQGLKLATVVVDGVPATKLPTPVGGGQAAASRPVWSFSLASAVPVAAPGVPASTTAVTAALGASAAPAAAGGKP